MWLCQLELNQTQIGQVQWAAGTAKLRLQRDLCNFLKLLCLNGSSGNTHFSVLRWVSIPRTNPHWQWEASPDWTMYLPRVVNCELAKYNRFHKNVPCYSNGKALNFMFLFIFTMVENTSLPSPCMICVTLITQWGSGEMLNGKNRLYTEKLCGIKTFACSIQYRLEMKTWTVHLRLWQVLKLEVPRFCSTWNLQRALSVY